MSRLPTVHPTFADRLVNWFNPVAGAQRLRARMMTAALGGYTGGRRDRRSTRNWRGKEESANVAVIPDLPDLRWRSRDLIRNMPLAGGAIATNVTNVIGDGLVPRPQIDRELLGLSEIEADRWQAQARREFMLFAMRSDFTRVQNFFEQQQLVFRAQLESGDVLAVRRFRRDAGDSYGLKVQIVEADRLCNQDYQADSDTLVAGVVINADGVHTSYQIADRHPLDIRNQGARWTTVPARDTFGDPLVIHMFERLRPDLARGVPYLAPVIEALKMLSDYAEAELKSALISAMLTVFITRPDAGNEDAPPVIGDAAANAAANEVELGSGAIVDLAPGEKPEFVNPGRPNPEFDPFVLSILRQVGVALDLPFEILIKHFTSSYSASRAALEMAWQMFRRRRTLVADRFCDPVYAWLITEAVASGRLIAPGFFEDPVVRAAWLGCEWDGTSPIALDPKKEADADKVDLETGAKTLEEITQQRTGGNWRRKIEQRGLEEKLKREVGMLAATPSQPTPDPLAPADPLEE
ncbi:phage portal protein, lambda family [Kaistia soli DSM 19436]|uniref:Phage portal protein, lambda family n=1 Tax=Kaistia soli DSM 19436 TaxID=1122133 RepID=A0A1M4VFR2_9HYPH|nr:phage portal protein [Kaistia soli]SHE67700.1 phage portal protein, lambda family [Kaistia soli DSM 19436]